MKNIVHIILYLLVLVHLFLLATVITCDLESIHEFMLIFAFALVCFICAISKNNIVKK